MIGEDQSGRRVGRRAAGLRPGRRGHAGAAEVNQRDGPVQMQGYETADAVVVGGGTVGAWCAYFLRRSGLDRVVLVEKRTLGQGASSRAAGVVRTQGGTPWAVKLGEWSRRFYLSQHEELGIDSGFTPQGYLLPCFTEAEVAAARERMAMQTPSRPVRPLA